MEDDSNSLFSAYDEQVDMCDVKTYTNTSLTGTPSFNNSTHTDNNKLHNTHTLPSPSQFNEDKLDPFVVWWKNAPFLYHTLLLHKLDWPSLTVSFLNNSATNRTKYTQTQSPGWFTQKLLLGTSTSKQEVNYVLIGEAKLPVTFYLIEDPLKCENYSGFITPRNRARQGVSNVGCLPSFEIKGKLVHYGDVNRALSMPQNEFHIVTNGEYGFILLYDYSKHPSTPTCIKTCRPQYILEGHSEEGYGLCWDAHRACLLASCSQDGTIASWDTNMAPQSRKSILNTHSESREDQYVTFPHDEEMEEGWQGEEDHEMLKSSLKNMKDKTDTVHTPITGEEDEEHDKVVLNEKTPVIKPKKIWFASNSKTPQNDIVFHPINTSLLASCGEDGHTNIWDLRIECKPDQSSALCISNRPINTLAFNHHSPYLYALGDDEGLITLWDLRLLCEPLLKLQYHTNAITRLQFNVGSASLLGSASQDGSVLVWDISRHNDTNNNNKQQKQHLQTQSTINSQMPSASFPHYKADSQNIPPTEHNNYASPHKPNLNKYTGPYRQAHNFQATPSSLIFSHRAHKSPVTDFTWNLNHHEPYFAASVGWDNRLCCWHMSELALLDQP